MASPVQLSPSPYLHKPQWIPRGIDAMRPALLLLIVCVSAGAQPNPSAEQIVRRSVERDASNFARFKDYTYHELLSVKSLDKKDKVNNTGTVLSEIMMLGGRPYERVLERDGKPLSEKDAAKQQEKLDKEAEKRSKETDRDRAKYEKERQEERQFAQEIPAAFNFTMLGEEELDGLGVWKIYADPKPGFKPRNGDADILKKVRGTVWIDKAGYQWVRAELEVIDTISWGFFVFRIPPGAKISFVQTRVNDEVWLPHQIHVRTDAKIALIKTFHVDIDVSYSDYHKFHVESQVIDVESQVIGVEENAQPKP
jgi:hypothetical protein